MKTLALASLLLLAQSQVTKIDTKDWRSFTGKSGAFSIKAPKDWASSDPNDPDHLKAIEIVKKNNPQLAKLLEDSKNSGDDLYLMQIAANGVATPDNLNEKIIPGVSVTEDLYDQVFDGLIAQTKLKKSGHKTIQLPVGQALSYWGEMSISVGGETKIDLKMFGYMMAKGGNTYVVTMTTTPDNQKAKATFDEMARSIAIKS